MNKITLILSDIHHKVDQATKIINHVGADEVICTGDVFDDFDDTPDMVKNTCEWLEWFVNKPNHIFIRGNHDVQYQYAYRKFQCSGYEQWKYFIIHDTIQPEVWDKVKWYHFLDDRWLLSHGGLHKYNVPDSIVKFKDDRKKYIEEISKYLDHEIIEGFKCIADNRPSWIFNAGYSRGGDQSVGGITWCDHNEEFIPVDGLSQIYGHTPQIIEPIWVISEKNKIYRNPASLFKFEVNEKTNNTDNSYNLCLDVHKIMHWATWDGKTMKLGAYVDL